VASTGWPRALLGCTCQDEGKLVFLEDRVQHAFEFCQRTSKQTSRKTRVRCKGGSAPPARRCPRAPHKLAMRVEAGQRLADT